VGRIWLHRLAGAARSACRINSSCSATCHFMCDSYEPTLVDFHNLLMLPDVSCGVVTCRVLEVASGLTSIMGRLRVSVYPDGQVCDQQHDTGQFAHHHTSACGCQMSPTAPPAHCDMSLLLVRTCFFPGKTWSYACVVRRGVMFSCLGPSKWCGCRITKESRIIAAVEDECCRLAMASRNRMIGRRYFPRRG
jgi:hypothetical protein